MFAYCLNNPVNIKDLGGSIPTRCAMVLDDERSAAFVQIFSSYSELTIFVGESSVVIDAYMVFEGDIDKDILIKGIKDYWEGDYDFSTGTKTVTVNIHCGTTSDGRAIRVTSKDEWGTSGTRSTFIGMDQTRVTIYSRYGDGRSKNVGWSMAHEFGHCLGIEDYYTHSNESWYEPNFSSIMNTIGKAAQLRDIIMAINASSTGERQLWEQWYS